MSDTEENKISMAECGSCRAIISLDSKDCPECGVSFSGVSNEALGECGACNALVPIDSKNCPECGVYFVADEVLDVLRDWFNNTGIDSRVLFSKFDSDSDGSIDAEELKEGLLKLNLADLPPSQIDRLITEVDTDNDGVISLDELIAAINGDTETKTDTEETIVEASKQYSENVVERIVKKYDIEDKETFLEFAKSFDENDNDYLTESELKKAAEAFNTDSGQEATIIEDSTDEDALEAEEEMSEEIPIEELEDDPAEEIFEEETADDVILETVEDSTQGEVDISEGDDSADEVDEVDESSSEQHLSLLVTAAKEQDMTIRALFETMDLDDDGLIDGPELQKGIDAIAGEYLSPGDIMEIISLVDKDSDGRVNAFELIEVIEEMDSEIESDRYISPIDALMQYMESLDIDAGGFFKKLDDNADGKINRNELAKALNNHANEDVNEEEIERLMAMFDSDDDDSIDLLEFIETLEKHDDGEVDEKTSLSMPKEFPSKWQKRMMSKKWKDVVWPLIHFGFICFIILWVVNGTLAPFVDGNGGTVPLDTEFGQTIGEDGTLYINGDPYPCDDTIQIDGCKNSLTPFAGEGGAISMPAKFYWDGILFIVLGTIGLIGGLFTQLSLVPAWRARVKAMRENESEKAEVKGEVESIDESESDDYDENNSEAIEADTEDEPDDEMAEDDETEDDEYEDDEIDIGSYIGLVLEDEEVFGTIIEFDDEEGLVTIEEDGTGDLVTGYQDDMFLED